MKESEFLTFSDSLFFLDTNIFIYSFDLASKEKQKIARMIIRAALDSDKSFISTQVIQEFLNVLYRRFPTALSHLERHEYLAAYLQPLCKHYPSAKFYDKALDLQLATGFAFYDTLIVQAAIETDCKYLFSEDLQHGRIVQGVQIINPFLS